MFEKIKVITFANGVFVESAKALKTELNSYSIPLKILTETDLSLEFKEEHKNTLQYKRGYGYWVWKPEIIISELSKLENDEILIYVDSTDLLKHNFFKFTLEWFKTNESLFMNRGFKHGEWTKRDCFILMGCDSEEYHNKTQLEAGLIGLKKTNENLRLLEEWVTHMKNEQILTDSENICGENNLPNFKEHRHDQSILTNLIIKKGLSSVYLSEEYVNYNHNQPNNYKHERNI